MSDHILDQPRLTCTGSTLFNECAQSVKSFQCSPFTMKSPCALSSQPANVYNPVDYVFFYSHKESNYGYGPKHANTVNEARHWSSGATSRK